jgi:hypothetical protein
VNPLLKVNYICRHNPKGEIKMRDELELYKGKNYVLAIYPDFCPTNPREWDNIGTMVDTGIGGCGDESFSDEREFFKYLAEDYMESKVAQKIMHKKADEFFSTYRIEEDEDGDFYIHTEDYYNPFGNDYYPSEEHALNTLNNYIDDWMVDSDSLDELEDGELQEIAESNVIIEETRNGYIFCTLKKVEEEYGNSSQESIDKAREYMRGEVKVYNQWADGQVYGFKWIKLDRNRLDQYLLENEEGKWFDEQDMSFEDLEDFKDKEDSCWGFYGYDIEENGMMDYFPKALIEELKDKF